MVARIKIGTALCRSFFYNENKVVQGVASCLLVQNYPIEQDKMSSVQKLNVLQKVASLRESLSASTVHISLNFDPSERLSQEKLKDIARLYMEKIGFAKQPYLVYEHNDSGHQHIHILTIKVDWSGKAIDTNFIALKKSEPARKELEIMFGLIKAEESKKLNRTIKPAYVQMVNYGKTESKKAISLVLSEVIEHYKFSSLAELNAVLNQYHVKADRGSETSRTYQNKGLHYKIIDAHGTPVGVPIKASLFAQKPTLKYLEGCFKSNETAKLPHKSRVKNSIDLWFLKQGKPSLEQLIKALDKMGIHTVLRQNEQGIIYGMTYVDHETKCVFNGSSLGKQYSAKAIQERCNLLPYPQQVALKNTLEKELNPSFEIEHSIPFSVQNKNTNSLLESLMQTEQASNYVPYELSAKKRRRKKRKLK